MKLQALQAAQLRELLVRLDRVATISRGHRAGLHLYDRSLMDQYVQILITWEAEPLGLPPRPTPPPPYSERPTDQLWNAGGSPPALGAIPAYRRPPSEIRQ